jgi:hypothetical protein
VASVDSPDPICQAFPDPIPGVLPFGTVTIFAGAPGVGKTAMLADWCARWRDGRTICGHPTNRPTAFYYLAADRQWASHQQWFELVGFPDIPAYSLADDTAFDIRQLLYSRNAHDHFLWCFNHLNPIPGSHVFIDPVSPLFIAGDPNRARDVAVSMLRFSRLCADRQINISCIAHFAKQKTDPKEQYTRPQDRIAGSGAFSGFTDTQIYLIDPVPPKQKWHILGWNPRHTEAETFHFKRNKQGLFVPYEGLVDEAKDGKHDRPTQVMTLIPDTDDGISLSDLFEKVQPAFEISLATLKRDLTVLLARGVIERTAWGRYKRRKLS